MRLGVLTINWTGQECSVTVGWDRTVDDEGFTVSGARARGPGRSQCGL